METDFLREINRLKSLRRKGWVLAGIEDAESVADHSWRTAAMAYLLAPKGIDRDKAVRMALLHELGEVYAGDLTPHDSIGKEEKHMMEKQAVERLCSLLDRERSDEIETLWKEYEAQETGESRFVKEIDVLEMTFQAAEYEKAQKSRIRKDMWTFWEYSEERIHSPALLKIFNDIKGKKHGNHK